MVQHYQVSKLYLSAIKLSQNLVSFPQLQAGNRTGNSVKQFTVTFREINGLFSQ